MWNVPQFMRKEMLSVQPLERGMGAALSQQAMGICEDMAGRTEASISALAMMLLPQVLGEYLWHKMGRPCCYVPQHLAELFQRSNFDVDVNSLRLPIDSFMLIFPKGFQLSDGTPLDQIHVFNIRSKLAEQMLDQASGHLIGQTELSRIAQAVRTDEERLAYEALADQPRLFEEYRRASREHLLLLPYFNGAQIGGRAMKLGLTVKAEPRIDRINRPTSLRRSVTPETVMEALNIVIAALCRYTTRPEMLKDYVLPRSERYNHKGDKKQKKVFAFLDPKTVIERRTDPGHEPAYTVRPHVRGFVYATLRDERWYRKDPLKPGEPFRIQEREPTIIHPEAFEPATT